jgi:hypothetical protein
MIDDVRIAGGLAELSLLYSSIGAQAPAGKQKSLNIVDNCILQNVALKYRPDLDLFLSFDHVHIACMLVYCQM